jgi:hypothetical protein
MMGHNAPALDEAYRPTCASAHLGRKQATAANRASHNLPPSPALTVFPYVAVICAALFCHVAFADVISFEVFNPTRIALPGDTVIFSGTVTNNTGASLNATDLFFNFSGFDPAVVGLTQLLGFTDFTLGDGTTTAPVDLFSFMLGANALSNQTYVADTFLQTIDGDMSNVVTVSVTEVPEPATWLVSLLTLMLLIALSSREERTAATEFTLERSSES